ncbi:hypothetical protein NLU13_4131 [Sarocladium strictum]|uniref:Uncharacterized protein n=1 Tax=Sarocladium strictum TaxID=5046 RepID=A0AA39L7X1_SARSR|nr:hypothetical protein NLU13_4131 [Sarocladium strictum]
MADNAAAYASTTSQRKASSKHLDTAIKHENEPENRHEGGLTALGEARAVPEAPSKRMRKRERRRARKTAEWEQRTRAVMGPKKEEDNECKVEQSPEVEIMLNTPQIPQRQPGKAITSRSRRKLLTTQGAEAARKSKKTRALEMIQQLENEIPNLQSTIDLQEKEMEGHDNQRPIADNGQYNWLVRKEEFVTTLKSLKQRRRSAGRKLRRLRSRWQKHLFRVQCGQEEQW